MSATQEFFQSWIDAFNRPDGLDDYMNHYDDNVVLHGYPPGVDGKSGLRDFYAQVRAAVPDFLLIIDDVVIQDNRIAARYRLVGTHKAELLGVPATGKPLSIEGQTIAHIRDGKVVERWQALDEMGLMRQLQG